MATPRDPTITEPTPRPTGSADTGRPEMPDPITTAAAGNEWPVGPEPDVQFWLMSLTDAERAEREWRDRGRRIVQIYRNDINLAATGSTSRRTGGGITFNILYANTEVMLPAIYMQPPDPVVRARFSRPSPPAPPPMPMMPGMGPVPGPVVTPGMPPGAPPQPAPVAPAAAGTSQAPGGPPPPEVAAVSSGPVSGLPPPAATPPGPPGPVQAPPIGPPPLTGGGPPPEQPITGPTLGMPPPPLGVAPPPLPPSQTDIETAASVMEKALTIVVDSQSSHEAVKAAIKDVLLPGRGVCRVRWVPQMLGDQKVWEAVHDEYVYWEDLLVDPVRHTGDMNWVAFRHLFTKAELMAEFLQTSPVLEKLVAAGRDDGLYRWTEAMAAKTPVGGGAAMRSSVKLGDVLRKAMVWEIWDRINRRIIWFMRELGGLTLRVDPDVYQLKQFYPIPEPMLAVRTTDTRIPRAFYDLYAKLAEDLDTVSVRIGQITNHIRIRGGYNSASTEIADILRAEDNKMLPIDGVDMLNGGLNNHLWFVPVEQWMNAAQQLIMARDQLKQTIYEIMGISDIMRGATRASETATAQRIKGSMGMVRLSDAKQQASNFVRDLLRLKAELIGQNFDAATLSAMTGEIVTPSVLAILRDDFQRTASIDIEEDSTVAVDEQAEQQSMAMVMQSAQGVFGGIQAMLMTQAMPPNDVINFGLELFKLLLHPVRYSRGMIELIDLLQEKLTQIVLPPPGPAVPGAAGPPGGSSMPRGGPPPHRAPRPNGAPPVVPPGNALPPVPQMPPMGGMHG